MVFLLLICTWFITESEKETLDAMRSMKKEANKKPVKIEESVEGKPRNGKVQALKLVNPKKNGEASCSKSSSKV